MLGGSLPILYEDDSLVVINKPPGLLVHRSAATSRSEDAVLQLLRDQLNQRMFPVHRLDRATSGLLLVAKSSQVAANLAEQFAQHSLQKTYLAVVRGWPASVLRLDQALGVLDDPSHAPQRAISHLEVLARVELDLAVDRYPQTRYGLLRLRPETGRRHQLRRHCKSIFHPIINDTSYGHGVHNQFFRDHFAVTRLLLHHFSLEFRHPLSHEALFMQAPIDQDFAKILAAFGWNLSGVDGLGV